MGSFISLLNQRGLDELLQAIRSSCKNRGTRFRPHFLTVDQTTETTNEMFSAAVQRDTFETGYDKFHLINFKGLETPLEESVVKRVAQKLTHVKDFKVAVMKRLPT